MGTRGKTSTAGIIVKSVPTLRERLPAPSELTSDQAATWRAVVSSRPVDWFDAGSAPLLAAYCRTDDAQRVLATAIVAFDVNALSTPEVKAQPRSGDCWRCRRRKQSSQSSWPRQCGCPSMHDAVSTPRPRRRAMGNRRRGYGPTNEGEAQRGRRCCHLDRKALPRAERLHGRSADQVVRISARDHQGYL